MNTPLPDGFYERLSFADYLAQGRVGKGVLMAHRKTAAHAKAEMEAGKPATRAMRRGSLGHTLLLEPSAFNARYVVGPVSDRRVKAWKEWEAELDAATDARERITPNEHEAGLNMAAWMGAKPVIAELARELGPVESSVLWTERKLRLRARPDKLLPLRGQLLDVKTTTDLSDRALSLKIYDLGYHLQARLYLDGLAAVGQSGYREAVILWIESGPPFDARATVLGEEWLDLAEQELAHLKMQHAACVKSGRWPGYADAVAECPLPPAWAMDGLGDGFAVTIGGQKVAA
jgi:exodeoxyribonuclease VIII